MEGGPNDLRRVVRIVDFRIVRGRVRELAAGSGRSSALNWDRDVPTFVWLFWNDLTHPYDD